MSASGVSPLGAALRRIGPRTAAALLALALAAGVGTAVLVVVGEDPISAYQALFEGALGSPSALLSTLAQTTPVMLAALSFVVAFRAGIFNAGGQGQVVMGAFAAAAVGSSPILAGTPWPIHLALVVLGGALGGALWSLPPVLFKVWWGTNEILTSLMLSYVASLLNEYLVQGPFRAVSMQPGSNAQTESLLDSAVFPRLIAGSQVTFMLPLAVLLALVMWWGMKKTTLGYEMRFQGQAPMAALSAGMPTKRIMITAMMLSGALAGIAGAAVVGGVFNADITPFPPDIGFNGILAALLVGSHPLLVPLSAFFFGALSQGGLGLQIFTGVSQYIALILTATVIVFAAPRRVPNSVLRIVRSISGRIDNRSNR